MQDEDLEILFMNMIFTAMSVPLRRRDALRKIVCGSPSSKDVAIGMMLDAVRYLESDHAECVSTTNQLDSTD